MMSDFLSLHQNKQQYVSFDESCVCDLHGICVVERACIVESNKEIVD